MGEVVLLYRWGVIRRLERGLPSPCHQVQAAERLNMAGCWESEGTKKKEEFPYSIYIMY